MVLVRAYYLISSFFISRGCFEWGYVLFHSEKAQVRTEINPNVGGATSVPFSLSAVAVPAFNRDNPLLSVNWILRNADKALVQVS